ncbi:carbon-nitrogen hydrolase family protein [Erythrobacter sp. SG61-1L]|uniref:carbon-nitrogen hydrolase family protein n=1 Tax=Erythrobacter sp. SG61-1L TaxID=1603897 RepID=UPI0006C8EBD6|nr:carbon-nitrogen hydrolase family protein [Erythrobacter sp. SG61-1L]
MGDSFPKVKVAAVHAASPFLDREAGVEKACALIAEAAKDGAELIVFPETFIPGYPVWIWTHTPATGSPYFLRLFANSITVPSEATDRLGAAARKAGAYVAIGISEKDGGTLYNTLLYFDDSGQIVGRHRKLVPTCVERTVWGRGDGSGLKPIDTPFGKLGGLICWEHSMDLARYALASQGEQIHVAVWPAGSAVSHDPSSGVFDDLTEAAARHHAAANQCFVINVQSCVDAATIRDLGFEGKPDMVREGGGWTAIIAPTGQILAGPNRDREAILHAELDLSLIAQFKYVSDSIGHYSRPDVLRLLVNFEEQTNMVAIGQSDPAVSGFAEPKADPAPVFRDVTPTSTDGGR